MAKKYGGSMAQDDREKPVAKTTIVGGRPPGSGKEEGTIPRGIEILLKKASIDESFRKILLSDRLNAADAIGLTLNPVEVAMLKAIPETTLDRMIAATKVQPMTRQAFMGYAAAAMLAALTAAYDGIAQNVAQGSRGIQPDEVPPPPPPPPPPVVGSSPAVGGIRADIVGPPSPPSEERQAAQYKAESYMNIASHDKNAPRGNLEITIENWQNGGLNSGVFMKVHFTAAWAYAMRDFVPPTEGLGYARRGRFLQENIPVGEYLVEIAFVDQPYVRSKKVTVKEKETTKVVFQITSGSQSPTPGKIMTKGITIDIQ
jgi:hypothetical protein